MARTLIRYWGSDVKSPRAASALAAQLAPAAKRGWRVCLVCYRPPQDSTWLEPLHGIGVEFAYLPRAHGNFDVGCARRAYRLCREMEASVFHCDNIHTSPLIGAALARVPVRVWSKLSMEPSYEACREPGLRDRLAASLRVSSALATRVIAVSAAVRNEILALGIPASKVMVLHNPVEWGPPNKARRDPERTLLGYGATDLVILTIGHGVPVKGWDTLGRAFAELSDHLPEARLLFVGSVSLPSESPFVETLRRYLEERGLQARTSFLGHLTEIQGVLAAADIFVLPSRSEGFALALIEALAAGLPCVSTRVGGAADVIVDGINGYVVDREDHSAIAQRLLVLGRDPVARRRIGEAARIRRDIPEPREHGEQLFAMYESLLGPGGL